MIVALPGLFSYLFCNAYLDGYKILIVLSIPLLDDKESYEIYKIHNLPLSKRGTSTVEDKMLDLIAKYDLSVEALMINKERTKYALLSSNDFDACNNRYMPFCYPKSPIYQINLLYIISKSCIIALFLKNGENVRKYCKSTVYFDSQLPVAEYIHSGVWVVATYETIKFTIVCQDQSEMQCDITVYPPLGIVKLNMTCGAANDYLCLPPYYKKEVKGHISDTWGSLLKLRNITQFSLWRNFSSVFPNVTSVEITDDLKNLKQGSMSTFIDYVHNYRKVDVGSKPVSVWTYVIIIFSTYNALAVVIFMYKRYFHKKISYDFSKRLADCCSDKNGVAGSSTIEEKSSVSSEPDEIFSHKSGRQISSTPDQKKAKVLISSLMRDTKKCVVPVAPDVKISSEK